MMNYALKMMDFASTDACWAAIRAPRAKGEAGLRFVNAVVSTNSNATGGIGTYVLYVPHLMAMYPPSMERVHTRCDTYTTFLETADACMHHNNPPQKLISRATM